MEAPKALIESLTQEAAGIQIHGSALRPDEMARVQAIDQVLPYLKQALEVFSAEISSPLVTRKIVTDVDGQLTLIQTPSIDVSVRTPLKGAQVR